MVVVFYGGGVFEVGVVFGDYMLVGWVLVEDVCIG